MPLWHCHEPPQAYSDAYKASRGSLVNAGYSWTGLGHQFSHLVACWWDTGLPYDADALKAEVDRVVTEAAAWRDEQGRREAEGIAAEVAEVATTAALIRRHLEDMLRDRPWAFGRHLAFARDLVAKEDWTRHGVRAADRYLSNARGNVERANERLGRVPPANWFARADDAQVRVAALEACRFLSARDEDWAAVRNSSGWSQATTWRGHVVSERESLDQGEAAHALGILHGHRKQIPYRLAHTLFYRGIKCPKQYPAPEDAVALLL
ncbi:hypothetical protein [Methylobacterium sp. E-016]|uniref:hypothetical protein n=1 Tax=Methylobacterium sp. E-016 TaxID=2836556 RepID=UPI001FBB6611|nr:hypothetical protein [Methylobacterium sp. E-016]